MKKLLKFVVLVPLWMMGNASASMISDAPYPYGVATHTTPEWQYLGADSNVDDGVKWSIDGGTTWGNDALTVGDEVIFSFDLWTSGTGAHDYNQVKAWVDWNQDFTWSNDPSEIVLEDLVKREPYSFVPPETYTLTSNSFLISEDMIGDLWLRARAQCNHVPYGQMTPDGNLWQGEVEDWRLTVNPVSVPEPASILLLGTGLLGLVGARSRRA